jgi:hypothetical protein
MGLAAQRARRGDPFGKESAGLPHHPKARAAEGKRVATGYRGAIGEWRQPVSAFPYFPQTYITQT